jgi:hypothetical protein
MVLPILRDWAGKCLSISLGSSPARLPARNLISVRQLCTYNDSPCWRTYTRKASALSGISLTSPHPSAHRLLYASKTGPSCDQIECRGVLLSAHSPGRMPD